jgi:hypothetical protein
MHYNHRDPSGIIVNSTTGDSSRQNPSAVLSVYPSQSPALLQKPPIVRSTQTSYTRSGQISPIPSHHDMNAKEGNSRVSAVTISPLVQEETGVDGDGHTEHNQTNTFPIPRPTRENVLRRLSEALMRRSLTMVSLHW